MSLRVNHNMSAINTHRSVLNNSNAQEKNYGETLFWFKN